MMNNNTVNNEIIDDICELLTSAFKLEFDSFEGIMDRPLLGYPFELTAIQLYQFLMLVEEKFQIYITPDFINKYGFLSISHIERLIIAGYS